MEIKSRKSELPTYFKQHHGFRYTLEENESSFLTKEEVKERIKELRALKTDKRYAVFEHNGRRYIYFRIEPYASL